MYTQRVAMNVGVAFEMASDVRGDRDRVVDTLRRGLFGCESRRAEIGAAVPRRGPPSAAGGGISHTAGEECAPWLSRSFALPDDDRGQWARSGSAILHRCTDSSKSLQECKKVQESATSERPKLGIQGET
jgi:hypothetical protein